MFGTIISLNDFRSLQQEDPYLIVIDCRFTLSDPQQGRREYEDSHIIKAHYAHLDDDLSGEIIPGKTGRHPLPDPQIFDQLMGAWDINWSSQVVVYDHWHGGVAARLWWMMNWLGHEKVAVLEGGWRDYFAGGHPTEASVPTRTNLKYGGRPSSTMVCEANAVETMRQNNLMCVLDARATKRYSGEEEPIDPIAGHIDGAVNLPFLENLDSKGQWKPKEELRQRYMEQERKGISNTVVYCGSGVTACHNILAMEHCDLGLAKLYPGSWSEWITSPERL